eukprot:g6105.t1
MFSARRPAPEGAEPEGSRPAGLRPKDCGQGSCPESLEESPVDLRCICPRGWLGTQCEIKDFEEHHPGFSLLTAAFDSHRAIRFAAADLNAAGCAGNHSSTRIFGSTLYIAPPDWSRLSAAPFGCPSIPCWVCHRLGSFGAQSGTSPRQDESGGPDFAAVQVPATSGGGLVSYTFLRLKSSARLQEALPMASMPSPATVLLTALGSSEVCRAVGNAANTTVCYDLASSNVKMSCGSSPGHCRIDLNLGISDPYPCPCSLPDDTFLGFGNFSCTEE